MITLVKSCMTEELWQIIYINDLAGFVKLAEGPKLEELFIDPAFRRKGIGSSAIRILLDVFRSIGRSELLFTMYPLDPNTTMQELKIFYSQFGYEELSVFGGSINCRIRIPEL